MTQLTEHFSLEELTASSTGTRLGIDNTPTPTIASNLVHLAVGLESVRSLLGNNPLHIDSGYRSPTLNRAVGGSGMSAHMQGYAADFTCAAFGTPLQIVQFLQSSGLHFDQIIQEGTWVHISFDPAMRQQVLTAHFGPGGTTYSQGA